MKLNFNPCIYTGDNLTSLLFMNVYRIYILLFVYLHPFVDELTKRGEKNLEFIYASFAFFYAYIFVCLCAYIKYLFILLICMS